MYSPRLDWPLVTEQAPLNCQLRSWFPRWFTFHRLVSSTLASDMGEEGLKRNSRAPVGLPKAFFQPFRTPVSVDGSCKWCRHWCISLLLRLVRIKCRFLFLKKFDVTRVRIFSDTRLYLGNKVSNKNIVNRLSHE